MLLDIVLQYNLLLPVFEDVRKIIMKALALVGSHIMAWTQEKQWAHRNLKVLKQTVSKVASPSKLDLRSSILNLWLSIFLRTSRIEAQVKVYTHLSRVWCDNKIVFSKWGIEILKKFFSYVSQS